MEIINTRNIIAETGIRDFIQEKLIYKESYNNIILKYGKNRMVLYAYISTSINTAISIINKLYSMNIEWVNEKEVEEHIYNAEFLNSINVIISDKCTYLYNIDGELSNAVISYKKANSIYGSYEFEKDTPLVYVFFYSIYKNIMNNIYIREEYFL